MAVELVMKGVLASKGVDEKERIELGHDLQKIAIEFAKHLPAANDAELFNVVRSMPKYADVRYKPPALSMAELQNVYRRCLFVCAETLSAQIIANSFSTAPIPPPEFGKFKITTS